MNLKNIIYLFILLLLPAFISGEIKKYKLQNNINCSSNVVVQIIDDITVQKLELSILESKDIFGEKNGIKIDSIFQPILVSVKNDSKQAVTIDSSDINLNIVNSNDVTKQIKKGFLLRSFLYASSYLGYLVVALPVGFGLLMGSGAPNPPIWLEPGLVTLFLVGYGLPIIMLADIYNGKVYNDSLLENFKDNSVSKKFITTLAPNEEFFKLIFVNQEDYDGIFNFEITCKDSKKIKFEL